MNTLNTKPLKTIVGVLAVLSILALVIGTASADLTTPAVNSNDNSGAGTGQPNYQAHWGANVNITRLQTFITHLQQQGVTVPDTVTAALQSGDTATVMTWLKANRPAHVGTQANGPRQFDPQKIITQLQQQGVTIPDTVTTALQNGDTATVNAWLKSYIESHKGTMAPNHPFRHHMKGSTTTPTPTPTTTS